MRTISWIAVEPRLPRASARNSLGQPLTCSTVPIKKRIRISSVKQTSKPRYSSENRKFQQLDRRELAVAGPCGLRGRGMPAPMIDRTTSLGVGCYRGGQVCKPGGRPYADAHDSLLAENVNSLLCRLNLRPKNPEGCQPAYQTTRLPLYDTNGSCTPYLNFSFIT